MLTEWREKTNLIDAEKATDKIQYLFITKTLNKLELEGDYFNTIKAINKKPTVKSYQMRKTESFPLWSRTR